MHSTAARPILIVEDSDEDFATLRWIFNKLGLEHPIKRCVTGDEALEYLYSTKQLGAHESPLLILLDLNLPGTDGRELLTEVKNDALLRLIPVIVLTTSGNPKDVRQSYYAGANAYMIKPVNLEKLTSDLRAFCQFWLQSVTFPIAEE
jgi:CheY-like chemotaxis protein